MTYLFETNTTMKDYNAKKWWISSDIIPRMKITADDLKTALQKYRDKVQDEHYIEISENALKTRNPMYIDTADGAKQVGYVITAKTEFQTDDYKWSKQYIDLWVTIHIIQNAFEEE